MVAAAGSRAAEGRRWPAALLWVAVLGTTLGGGALVRQLLADRPVEEATVEGLFLRLDRAEWLLDQMDHGERYPMPQSMMPDMPPHGVMRLAVEVSLHNPSGEPRRFRPSELFFRASERGMWPAAGGEMEQVSLEPGRALNMFAHFDVAETEIEGDLRLLWVREGATVQMLAIGHPPEHDHEAESTAWPPLALSLPEGDPAAGEKLYFTTLACVSCHGDPRVAGSHTVGPHLGGIAARARSRVTGQSAIQYLYMSLLEPQAFLAPDCKTGPCESPSSMPPFGDLIRPGDMPDLLAFLLAQTVAGDEPL